MVTTRLCNEVLCVTDSEDGYDLKNRLIRTLNVKVLVRRSVYGVCIQIEWFFTLCNSCIGVVSVRTFIVEQESIVVFLKTNTSILCNNHGLKACGLRSIGVHTAHTEYRTERTVEDVWRCTRYSISISDNFLITIQSWQTIQRWRTSSIGKDSIRRYTSNLEVTVIDQWICINTRDSKLTVNNQFMWNFTINCNCCGSVCLRTCTSTHTGDTYIISNNWSNNFKFRQFRLHVPGCREIADCTTRTITIGLLNLVIVHVKVSCTGRSTNTNSIHTICIFKYSQFVVRISWTISVGCIVSINRTLRITIKNSELPEVTSTSDTEDCRS